MEDNSTPTQTWFNHAAKNGLILGGIHIVIFLILYAFIPNKTTGFSYVFVILILNFGYTIYQGSQYRNDIGGFIEYGASFKYAFILLLANGLLYTVFSVILLIVDPQLPEIMAQSQLDTSMYWAQKMGAPEESLDQMREQFDPEKIAEKYSFVGMLSGLGIAAVLYAIGAAIMALFIRKSQPIDLM